MEKTGQRGFAMIVALFLVIAVSTVVAGDFLALARQQRTIQRAADQIKVKWVNESILDRTIKYFTDYVSANGDYPYKTASCTTDEEGKNVCEVSLVSTTGTLLSDAVAAWYPTWTATLGGLLSDISPAGITISVGQIGDTADPRDYRIELKSTRPLTGVETYVRHKIQVSAGGLFDYFMFYDDDLEINPGSDWTVDGPMFTNGNAYLTTAPGSTLTLRTPVGETPTLAGGGANYNYNVLRAAGNIYFYFKRAVGKNYFLDGRNPIYKNYIANAYRTDDFAKSGPSFAPARNSWTEWIWDYVRYRAFPATTTSSNAGLLGVERTGWGPPTVYFFKNSIRIQDNIINEQVVNPVLQVLKSDTGSTIPLKYYSDHSQWYDDDYLSRNYYGTDHSDYMNMSMAYDPSSPDSYPQMLSGWVKENPVTSPAIINPNWPGSSIGPVLEDRSKGGVEKRIIPINSANGPHALIEPIQGTDSSILKTQKLAGQAHIRVVCQKSDSCRSAIVYKYVGPTAAGADSEGYKQEGGNIPEPPTTVKQHGISVNTLKDWRLGGQYYVVDIDIDGTPGVNPGLKAFLQDANNEIVRDVTGKGFTGFVVYVEVADGPYTQGGENKIALVRLYNGSHLPKEGLTIVTNGRLWIQGDYNTTRYTVDPNGDLDQPNGTCSPADWERNDGTCRFPPAAIYSDSIGFLSGTTTQSSTTRVVTDAAKDSMVNVAVVTGYLPSQLVEKYPNCTTTAGSAVSKTNCFHDWDLWTCSSKFNAFSATTTYWNTDGTPRDPDGNGRLNTCAYTYDKDKAIYNLRTIYAFSEAYKGMAQESYGYHIYYPWAINDGSPWNIIDDTMHRQPGCQNRLAQWAAWGLPTYNPANPNNKSVSCPEPPRLNPDPADPEYHAAPCKYRGPLVSGKCPTSAQATPAGTISALYKLYRLGNHPESATAVPNGTNFQKENVYNIQKWSDFSVDDMNELKDNSATLFYQVPMEMNTGTPANPVWTPMCQGDVACDTSTGTVDNTLVLYRYFDMSFDVIPEISNWDRASSGYPAGVTVPTVPFFSTGAMSCSNSAPNTITTTRAAGGEFVPYGGPGRWPLANGCRYIENRYGCQVEPAPVIAGVPSYSIHDYWFGRFNRAFYNGWGECVEYTPGCGNCEICPACECTEWVDHPPSDPGPNLRWDNNITGYDHPWGWWFYEFLYEPRYSGGVENLINFQEMWRDTANPRTFHFGGVLTAVWHSQNLKTTGGPAFYDTDYYSEPVRKSQYDRNLKSNSPAGTPGVYSIKRLRFQELDPRDRTKVLGPQN